MKENEMIAVVKEVFKHFTRATFRVAENDYRLQQDCPYEPPHGKTNYLHMRKQRRRSASR